MKKLRVAIAHDWLTGMRGGERVLEVLLELYPEAKLFTLFYEPERVSAKINRHEIETSFIQHLPFARRYFRSYLPLFPMAVEQFDLRGYDLVISSSHCCAKGVITRPKTFHLCYCYTPMRYAWDMYHEYFRDNRPGWLRSMIISPVMTYLRLWDVISANRVDCFTAISQHVAKRIRKHYHREAEVIYPPVDTKYFTPLDTRSDDYFLVVSAFVPYKKIDLAIAAFNKMGAPLKIVGDGPGRKRLLSLAKKNIEFVGELSNRELHGLYAGCRALVFPGEEDLGLTPLEAQACGRPVIAYGYGGSCETVKENETGIFFDEQTPDGLIKAVKQFEKVKFNAGVIREHALKFNKELFKTRIDEYIKTQLSQYHI